MKRGDWITNHPKPIESFWPRRTCKYIEGLPKKTDHYSVEEFISMGYIGIYLDEDVEDYYSLTKVKNPKEFKI